MNEIPKTHLIGNAHLDPIWLWRWTEGCGEVLQTFRSALDRLKEYEDFVFTCSSAAYYKWVEDIDPAMFGEIVERVKEGRWVPVNGWWVQPDCNMPSGESFARQALYSQLYYYEKFGRICSTGYNVDSFGHNANLPQLLRQGGMNAYVMMRPGAHENPDVPGTFLWESADGSKVLTYKIPTSYAVHSSGSLDEALALLDETAKKEGHGMMLFYGVGNHGGGPTRGDIEHLLTMMRRDGYSELEFSSPDGFFMELSLGMPDLPVWKDELQHHASGCYSATSLVKMLNRRAENALFASEAFATVANKTAGMQAKTADYKEAWRDVCFNQFHDVLCGCSIMEAYRDVRDSEGHAITISDRLQNEALLRLAHRIDTWVEGVSEPYTETRNQDARFPRPIVVFNPLSFPVKTPVRTYHPSSEVRDADGNAVPFQNVRSSRSNDSHLDTVFLAQIPALGYATYWLKGYDENNAAVLKTDVFAEGLTMENRFIKATFDKRTGAIVSLVDKESGFDYASAEKPVAVPVVIDDRKTDTWAHNVFRFHDVKGGMALQSIELIEAGPVRAVIRTKHSFGQSLLTQDFILGSEQRVLRVKCKARWAEDFTMLKMSFPVTGDNLINTCEIAADYIKRPANGEEEPMQKWTSVSFDNGARRTLALVNDGKYSYDCPGSDLRITLLRNVIFADHYSHRPAADFNFTDEGMQRFEYGISVFDGEAENSRIANEALAFNIRPTAIPESFHKGDMPQRHGFIEVHDDNILMTAFKLCEDGSGDAVMRLYESRGKETHTYVLCDMLDAGFRVDFMPHEIKTFRIDKNGRVSEVNFLEGVVPYYEE
ncbi:MAG: alpha-mannosidase [Clostridia bacterium]|nr:alpha-mannosidase [Clostridia bacterium]